METRAIHIKNLRGLTTIELNEKALALKKELFNLRFQFMAGQAENPSKIRQTKREIALVKTIVCEKQKGETKPAAGEVT